MMVVCNKKKNICCILRHCHADTKTNTFSQNIIGNDIFKPQYKPNSAKKFRNHGIPSVINMYVEHLGIKYSKLRL